jgi:membrane protein DedA with SNARE-associated domain
MSLEEFLASYGYWAVFVGSLLEGETILALAGFAAQQNHLSLPWVIAFAFAGGTLGDLFFFWLGSRFGKRPLTLIPGAERRATALVLRLDRYDALLIIGIRFMYGLRIVGPIAMGAVGIKPIRFAFFNAIGAAIWAPLIAGAGYLFGHALERLLGDLQHFEEIGLVVIVVLMVGSGVVLGIRARKRS